MKLTCASVFFCVFGILLDYASCQDNDWKSPDGMVTISLESVNSAAGPVDHLLIGGSPAKLISHSPIRRENHGYGWLNSVSPKWIDNEFVVFEDEMGLCLVNIQQQAVLLNQVFTGYTRSPKAQAWAAIRYRPTSRNQEQLVGTERDAIWIIEPDELAANAKQSTSEKPFAHVAALQLDGIAVAKPIWSDDGAAFAIAKQLNGKIAADVFDHKQRALIRSVPLLGMELTQEQLLSVWLIPEVEHQAFVAIKEANVFDLTNSQSVPASDSRSEVQMQRTPVSDAPKVQRTSTPSEEPSSSTAWSIIAVLIVATGGLLWWLGKRRS
jgi:hypothetical protein